MDAPQHFELPVATLRIFQRAVQCIAKLGKDAALIFQQKQLVLRGADDGHSSALHFVFGPQLFHSAARGATETKVVVVARQLLLPLSGAQAKNAEAFTLRLQGQRIFLEFSSRHGGKVRHGVPLLETLPFLPESPACGPHAAAMAPSLLAKVMQHCIPQRSGCEEVTLGAAAEGLRIKSQDLTSAAEAGSHRTEVLVQMSDLEACHLDACGGEVRLLGRGLRDFAKAAEVFATQLDTLKVLHGSLLLELRFGPASGSVLCSVSVASNGLAAPLEDFQAMLLVAVRESSGSLPAPSLPATPAPASAPASASAARKPQPRQGPKRRAVEATMEDFDAFPEHSQRPVIDLTQTQTQSRPPELQLFTPQQKAQLSQASQATQPGPQLSQLPVVPPSPVAPPVAPPVAARVNGGAPPATGSWWHRATPPAQVASLSRPAPPPVLASELAMESRDPMDSDDELIGADPDEIAFARGDQEEEAPDWFDCEKLW